MKVEIIQARVSHIQEIASRIRPADKVELWDFACVTPAQAMYYGLNQARLARTGFIDGEAVCMMGLNVPSIVSGVGVPWLVGTTLIEKHQSVFLRKCKPMIAEMLTHCEMLENWVSVENTLAIKWLAWLKFKFDTPEPKGIYRKMFMRFWQERV